MKSLVPTSPTESAARFGDVETPLYIVSANRQNNSDASAVVVKIHRMDGMPAFDRHGERLRSDRENWLTLPQAMSALLEIMEAVPTYSIAEENRNLQLFNEEFGYEVAEPNRKFG